MEKIHLRKKRFSSVYSTRLQQMIVRKIFWQEAVLRLYLLSASKER